MDQGIEYAKIVVLYMLMVSVAEDERALNILVKVYVFSTMLYVFHSLLEYINGRHVYRMGIARMIGVDSTMNDPNAFGATIVLSLPFVYALLKSELSTKIRNIYYIYFAMAVTCVVLTGSRSSFVATMVLFLIWMIIQKGRKKIRLFLMLLLFLPLIWIAMPQDKQDRFSTLWDEEAGPENAQQSAEGRKEGWIVSWRIFKQNPLTGVGAGGKNFIGYRLDHGIDDEGHASATQSHNLYGEVLAEFGAVGGILLIGLIASIWRSSSKARSYLEIKGLQDCFEYRLGGAIIASLVLLLVFGLAGHNFYRPLWLWLAAWAGILLKVVRLKRIDNER
ncbi:MAG: O-antigen ligase family protein [Dissulfurispiraceae bacterium]|nr:O-antigen ligase family protein [Dissulfurispiraceae bacterium]